LASKLLIKQTSSFLLRVQRWLSWNLIFSSW